ncbi:alpha/beta fold hydrolase [Hymenobacter koreensis]|uniref:Alpha/beta hydrolase n=1 Tax=Hymenobacter koreensis TaxID=1084523 RepID=A0ABP8IX90_9BACT
MELQIKQQSGFSYVDEGSGEVLLLLHGLFGALSNWRGVIDEFAREHRVIIPMLPLYEMPLTRAGISGLVDFVQDFVKALGLQEPTTVLGNSLGGHLALVYTLRHPAQVKRLVLTGSSGLFEDSMGGSFPRRGDYAYVQERVAYTFYDPKVATKELVDEVFSITNSNSKCLRIITIARSAQRHNLGKDLSRIKVPTLLIWGLNDTITPPVVAHEFNRLLPRAELHFLDHCGHAPMMERPQAFNRLLRAFLAQEVLQPTASI